jgi:hypothetical protein
MTRLRIIVLVLLVPFAGSCDFNDFGAMCSDEYVYGVHVNLRCPGLTSIDDWSGTIRLISQGHTAELGVLPTPEPDLLTAYGAGERPGLYKLTVEAEGYQTWEQDNIRVSDNVCHVVPVTVNVELEQL